MKGWSPLYDEYILSDSPRLAPLHFNTGRHDIPRYLLNRLGNSRVAPVVVGNGPHPEIEEAMELVVHIEEGNEEEDNANT